MSSGELGIQCVEQGEGPKFDLEPWLLVAVLGASSREKDAEDKGSTEL